MGIITPQQYMDQLNESATRAICTNSGMTLQTYLDRVREARKVFQGKIEDLSSIDIGEYALPSEIKCRGIRQDMLEEFMKSDPSPSLRGDRMWRIYPNAHQRVGYILLSNGLMVSDNQQVDVITGDCKSESAFEELLEPLRNAPKFSSCKYKDLGNVPGRFKRFVRADKTEGDNSLWFAQIYQREDTPSNQATISLHFSYATKEDPIEDIGNIVLENEWFAHFSTGGYGGFVHPL